MRIRERRKIKVPSFCTYFVVQVAEAIKGKKMKKA